jgi:hypothetical protein
MDENDHVSGVGKIVTNLEALEFVIRIYLSSANNQKIEFPTPATTELPETYITNYMTLGELTKKYNEGLTPSEQIHCVDLEVVTIRDAFAHGRIFSKSESFPIELYKFAKPNGGKATVDFAETLTVDWPDVLSVVDETDPSFLRIEVKGSSLPLSDAFFFVSRHEWEVASDGKAYWFYLWIVRSAGRPECTFVTASEVAKHIASDQGDGRWDVLNIPFKCFWKTKQ